MTIKPIPFRELYNARMFLDIHGASKDGFYEDVCRVSQALLDVDREITISGFARLPELRALALAVLRQDVDKWDTTRKAISALASAPAPGAWKRWQDVRGVGEDIWFHFRNPADKTDEHVDKVDFGADGVIDCKHGCGLKYFSECQPCIFTDEVAAAIKDNAR